jgi:hypothetical protein
MMRDLEARTTRATLSDAVRTDPEAALASVAAAAMALWDAVLEAAARDPRPRRQVRQLVETWRHAVMNATAQGMRTAEELRKPDRHRPRSRRW